MKGSIVTRKLKDGTKRYDAQWRANGKQRWKTFHRRKDADRFLAATVKKVHEGAYQEISPLMMNELLDRWLTRWLEVCLKQGKIKFSTARMYRSILKKYLRPAFGEFRSDQVKASDVSDWVACLADRIGCGDLSPKTYNNIYTLLHAILRWARHPAQGYLAHDPLIGQERLTVPRVERRYLEPQEIDQLLKAAPPPHDTVIHLAVFTGLRRGEIFGLQWKDIDWGAGEGGRLFVRRSIVCGRVTTPKTEGSYRVVDVPRRTLTELMIHKEMFPPLGEGFIFRPAMGGPLNPDNWAKRRFVAIVKSAGLRRIGLHGLRHTYCSLLVNQGAHLKYVSRQLGHSSTNLTSNLY